MNQNPYAPPRAPVEDVRSVATSRARPAQVTNAIKLWVASYCLGLLAIVVYWDHFTMLQPGRSLILNQLFSLAVSAWLYYKIYLGRNWARITLLVVSILGIVMAANGTVRSIVSEMPLLAKVQMIIAVGINCVVLWLLFFSAGREWFQQGKNSPGA